MTKTNLSSPFIEKLAADLRHEFPRLTIEQTDSSIRVLPSTKDGFVVGLVDAVHEIVLFFGEWTKYELDKWEAIPIFQAGLRGEARLHEISRAGVAYHWRVEFLRNGVWVNEKNDFYSLPLSLLGPLLLLWRKQERIFWNDPGRLR